MAGTVAVSLRSSSFDPQPSSVVCFVVELTSKILKLDVIRLSDFGWYPIFMAILLRHSGSRNGLRLDRSAMSALSVTPLTQSLNLWSR